MSFLFLDSFTFGGIVDSEHVSRIIKDYVQVHQWKALSTIHKNLKDKIFHRVQQQISTKNL